MEIKLVSSIAKINRYIKLLLTGDDFLAVILEIGRYCAMDHNGVILNDSNLNRIDPKLLEVIDEAIKNYQFYLGNDLHSVYIRGSIPRGLGILGISDLDTIAITTKKPEYLNLQWTETISERIDSKHNCVNGIEFSFHFIEDILQNTSFSIIPFMLKTHSICVLGEDLTPSLPNFKANEFLGNEHLINLKKQIKQAKEDLTDNKDLEDVLDCCVWIMKIMIRSGLALTIVEEQVYTRDLYPAYKLFTKHYPEKEPEMKKALQYAINPSYDSEEIIDFLNIFGDWLIVKAEEWLQVHNPSRLNKMIY